MIQKNTVTSGTLFRSVRPREGCGCGWVSEVMAVRVRPRTLRLPDRRVRLRGPNHGEQEREAASRAVSQHDIAAARAGETPCQGQSEPGAAVRRVGAADARFEHARAE